MEPLSSAHGPEWLPETPVASPDVTSNVIDLLPYLHSDHGNAQRLITFRGGDLRYCSALNKWLVWNGRCWAVDAIDSARQAFKETMLEFLRQAISSKTEAAEKFAKSSLDTKRISNGLREAQHVLAILPEDLDRDPWAFNFANRTVDLRTGIAREHARKDFITRALHANFLDAKCPLFLKFLEEITGGGPDASQGQVERSNHLMDYLQLAIGYSLTGVTAEKAVFLLHGPKDNGKSTLLATILRLLEGYAVVIQIDSLMVKPGGENANAQADLADLRGARFVMTSETEEGQRLAEGKLKRITQGIGRIKAVRKYENPIEFEETHKLWIDANHLPVIRSYDDAIWRRLHTIPLTVVIPRERQDRSLGSKLLSEAEGILWWAVQGAVKWHKGGLGRPEEVEQSGGAWRREMDRCAAFIDECCDRDHGGVFVRAAALYKAYVGWAQGNGERPMSGRAFAERLRGAGVEKRVDRAGTAYAISLRSPLLEGM
jgi:putative DNA primase/helicase